MIHQYVNNGYHIVLDVNSGSVHVVDEMAYRVIPIVEEALMQQKETSEEIVTYVSGELPEVKSNVKKSVLGRLEDEEYTATTTHGCSGDEEGTHHFASRPLEAEEEENKALSFDELQETVEEILALKDAEMLYTEDIYERYIDGFKDRQTVVKALCLHIAHDCNLACKYCFAGEGEYHGRRAFMSYEVGKKALDFLVANSGNRVNLEVDFFGGEPLMNWDVVKDLVAYGRSLEKPHNKKFRFTLTTNGVLLNDDVLAFANKEMANIVLSIDGRKEIHDLMRPRRGGQGSYDEVVPKYKKVAESRNQMNYYVRGTFTRNNLDFTEDVRHLADEGFEQISMEPVVAPDTEDYALRDEDVPALLAEYDKLALEYIHRKKEGKGFNFFHFMIDLEGGPCVAKRLSGCGSGTEYLAVTPWGDLYPCHQFVGQEDFLMGNVDEGIIRTDIRDTFKTCNVYAKEKCRDCFAKYYCSGGCAANAYNFSGSINGFYDLGCELQRKRVECAIMIKAALADEEKENIL